MVIEELKSWYNIDYELGEGVLSANTVNVWIGSAINRRRSVLNSETNTNKTEKSLSRSMMSEAEKLIEAAQIRSKNSSELRRPAAEKTPNQKSNENKSAVRS